MSSVKYGLISSLDAECIEATLNYIMNDFHDEPINTCCIGVFDGETDRGIHEYIMGRGRAHNHIAIDNQKDKPIELPYLTCKLMIGNSNEVYTYIPDESQDFIFVDGLHTFPMVVSDFYCYAPKLKVGGYIAFHDTGKHLEPLSHWQGVGDKSDPDMCIAGVRKALDKIGLLNNKLPEWKLIFDEADENDTGGGICILKRIKIWD